MTEYVEVARVTPKSFPYHVRCTYDTCYVAANVQLAMTRDYAQGFAESHVRATGHEVVVEERRA